MGAEGEEHARRDRHSGGDPGFGEELDVELLAELHHSLGYLN
jgi:hypothetical protein